MTGYGRGVNTNIMVEVRSTNHKGLDIQINIPTYLYPYEGRIRKHIRERFQRGRIELRVTGKRVDQKKPRLNRRLAKEYYKALLSLKDELAIPGSIDIGVLSTMLDIFISEEITINKKAFEDALVSALDDLRNARIREARGLVSDVKKRLRLLNRYVRSIDGRQKRFRKDAMTRMQGRLKELLKDVPVDESRMMQELAIMVDRSDITEEIVRIKSHLERMEELIASEEAVGKKLDFYAQELRREINTIGSKASDVRISDYVVEMKHEVEKIREQAQNLQ
jgi:uncharacterized protein (TIGR00255 family)